MQKSNLIICRPVDWWPWAIEHETQCPINLNQLQNISVAVNAQLIASKQCRMANLADEMMTVCALVTENNFLYAMRHSDEPAINLFASPLLSSDLDGNDTGNVLPPPEMAMPVLVVRMVVRNFNFIEKLNRPYLQIPELCTRQARATILCQLLHLTKHLTLLKLCVNQLSSKTEILQKITVTYCWVFISLKVMHTLILSYLIVLFWTYWSSWSVMWFTSYWNTWRPTISSQHCSLVFQRYMYVCSAEDICCMCKLTIIPLCHAEQSCWKVHRRTVTHLLNVTVMLQ